eukprot:4465688-Pyramimonas_sp.AAC.1
MLKHSGPDQVAPRVKEAAVFPAHDQPGQPQSRSSFNFLGQALVPASGTDRATRKRAIASKDHPLHVETPLEIATGMHAIKGMVIQVEAMIGE